MVEVEFSFGVDGGVDIGGDDCFGLGVCYELIANAERLGTDGKFIFDAFKLSGSPGTFERLAKLLCTSSGAYQHISCVLLEKETLDQKTDEGKLLVDVLKEGGVLVGIQVSTDELPDDFAECCQKYYEAGARFVKIYAKLEVDPREQSQSFMDRYANHLALCAAIIQGKVLVPIVGPDILINGLLINGTGNIDESYGVIERVLAACYKAFSDHRVLLEGTLLNPNAVIHGFEGVKVSSQLFAEATVSIFKRTVPAAVPVIILSHGNLNKKEPTFFDAVRSFKTGKPWAVTSIVTLSPNMLMGFTVEEGKMETFQAAFTQLCEVKAMASVLRSEMSEGFDTGVGGVADHGMPGGGGAVTFDTTIEMPESFVANYGMPGGGGAVTFDTVEMPEAADTSEMPGGGGLVAFDAIEMPEAADTSEMPGGGANSEMPGGGGPVPRASRNFRPAEYVYEFKFGFGCLFHFFFSATAQ